MEGKQFSVFSSATQVCLLGPATPRLSLVWVRYENRRKLKRWEWHENAFNVLTSPFNIVILLKLTDNWKCYCFNLHDLLIIFLPHLRFFAILFFKHTNIKLKEGKFRLMQSFSTSKKRKRKQKLNHIFEKTFILLSWNKPLSVISPVINQLFSQLKYWSSLSHFLCLSGTREGADPLQETVVTGL